MANFDDVKKYILEAEGEKTSLLVGDYGGLSKFGISSRAFPSVDIKNLTWDEACKIYSDNFFYKYRLDLIADFVISAQVMLLFINMNPDHAARIVQLSLNDLGCNVNCDGILGSMSISEINKYPGVRERITVNSIKYYLALVDSDTSQLTNLRSWIRRVLLTA